eukprot:scaffold20148_cov97-Isochrysis_galbana.AAC.3
MIHVRAAGPDKAPPRRIPSVSGALLVWLVPTPGFSRPRQSSFCACLIQRRGRSHLSRHRHVRSGRRGGGDRQHRRDHRYTRRRPVLRRSSLWHVEVERRPLKHVVGRVHRVQEIAGEGVRDERRLAHHVPQLPCGADRPIAAAAVVAALPAVTCQAVLLVLHTADNHSWTVGGSLWAERSSLDVQHRPAHGSPGQPGDHPHRVRGVDALVGEFGFPNVRSQLLGADDVLRRL